MNEITTLQAAPEIAQANQIAESAFETALAVKIDSAEMYTLAGDELRSIATRRKKIEELRLKLTRPLDEAKRQIMDLFRTPTARLEEAERLIKAGMVQYQQDERRKQEEERRRVEEQQRREREEQERMRREAEERERALREAAEAASRAGDEEQARRAAAEAARAAELAQEAEAQLALAEVAPPAPIAQVVPKAAGISTRQNWKAEVVDFAALVIAAGKAAEQGDTTLLGYLQANDKAIGQVARALKAQARIPGVRVFAEDIVAVRSAA